MRRSCALVSLLAGMVLLSGCSKGQGTGGEQKTVAIPPPPAVTGPASGSGTAAVDKPITAAELRQQANQLMGKGDYAGAITAWTKLVAVEPTADTWNELSFAYLQAQRWDDADKAGMQALTLEPGHPFASYNVGMARLEAGEYCDDAYLQTSANAQKDRYEPLVALSRLARAQNSYAMAFYYANRAAELASKNADVLAAQQAAAAMRTGAPPADLATASIVTLEDGPVKLYVYQEQQKTCSDGARPYTLYVLTAGGESLRLPIGSATEITADSKLTKTALPGGATGYWLPNLRQEIAYISGAKRWRLIALKGRDLGQVLFVNGEVAQHKSHVSDFVTSGSWPEVNGDVATAAYMDGASATTLLTFPWRLSADLRSAGPIAGAQRITEGTILKVGAEITIKPTYSRGAATELSYPLPAEVQVLRGGKPLTLAALQPGMPVVLTRQDNKLIRIDILTDNH